MPSDATAQLNPEQRRVVDRLLMARDYTLILGMPGTGKTSTIVAAIRALVSSGKTVLLTSYTNSAVDNVLLKLADASVPFVRLGRVASTMHPAVRDSVVGGLRHPDTSVVGLHKLAESVQVVRACVRVCVLLLHRRAFLRCIAAPTARAITTSTRRKQLHRTVCVHRARHDAPAAARPGV